MRPGITSRSGLTRTVILVGEYAVKLPRVEARDYPRGSSLRSWMDRWRRFVWGVSANIDETLIGRLGWPEVCPVVFSAGGFVLVARRVEVCTGPNFPEAEARELITAAQRQGRWVAAEIKPDSWGWLDGRLVAIDYA